MSELKPCPFCGYYGVPVEISTITNEKFFECGNCGASGQRIGIDDKYSTLLTNWNTRPIEDKLQAEIERLKSERRWIPVKVRLPEHGERVFVKMGNGWVGAAHYANTKEKSYRWMNTDLNRFLFEVTHWMPLPTPEDE